MIWVLAFLLLSYVCLILALAIGFSKVNYFTLKNSTPKTEFSILIPFRNEAKHLPQLMASLLNLDYPKDKFEIILVDDASSDGSTSIIQEILNNTSQRQKVTPTNITIIKNTRISNSPKKDAISSAIALTKYDWVITTDADCLVPKRWLAILDAFIQEKNPKMVVAPVSYEVNNTFLEQFQLLDFYSLQAATLGGFGIRKPFLCNGANLCYQKNEFLKLNGFQGNDEIASGDDIFLFEKFIQNDKNRVQFLKSEAAIVKTFPVKNWTTLMHQRVRWAAKSSKYTLKFAKVVGGIVLFANLSIVIMTTLTLFDKIALLWLSLLCLIKFGVDYVLLYKVFTFFKQKKSHFWYFLSSLLYPFFSSFVALKSIFTTYRWKGRTFKK